MARIVRNSSCQRQILMGLVIGAVISTLMRYTVLPSLSVAWLHGLLHVLLTVTVALAYYISVSSKKEEEKKEEEEGPAQIIEPAPRPRPTTHMTLREEGGSTVTRIIKAEEEENEERVVILDPLQPPPHFLAACNGDLAKANKRWAATLKWRHDKHIDGLLFEPNLTIEVIRRYYPHFLHGRGKQGEVVMYEMAGRMDMGGLKAAEGYTAADLARHSTYMQEFLWTILLPTSPQARMLTVMDMSCMSLRRLGSSDTSELIKATSEILNTHYPERVSRILVVNVPSWLSGAWSLIANLMPAPIREKIKVLSDLADLHTYIDPSHIPLKYGGKDTRPCGESDEEKLLMEMVVAIREGKTGLALPLPLACLQQQLQEEQQRKKAKLKEEEVVVVGGLAPPVTGAGEEDHAKKRFPTPILTPSSTASHSSYSSAAAALPPKGGGGGHTRHQSTPPLSWHGESTSTSTTSTFSLPLQHTTTTTPSPSPSKQKKGGGGGGWLRRASPLPSMRKGAASPQPPRSASFTAGSGRRIASPIFSPPLPPFTNEKEKEEEEVSRTAVTPQRPMSGGWRSLRSKTPLSWSKEKHV